MSACKRQRGSSLPEMAIILVVLLAFLFAIVDFGRATYTYAFVAQLARQGARWTIVRGSQCVSSTTVTPPKATFRRTCKAFPRA